MNVYRISGLYALKTTGAYDILLRNCQSWQIGEDVYVLTRLNIPILIDQLLHDIKENLTYKLERIHLTTMLQLYGAESLWHMRNNNVYAHDKAFQEKCAKFGLGGA